MGTQSYLSLYTTIIGWLQYQNLWRIIEYSGLAFLPFVGLVISNFVKLLESQEAKDAGLISQRRMEIELVSMLLVIMLACQPLVPLNPHMLSYAPVCVHQSEVVHPGNTGTTYDISFQHVLSVTKAVFIASIVNILAVAGAFVMFSLSFESNFSIMESLIKNHWGASEKLAQVWAYFLATPLSFIYAGADYLLYGAAMRKFIMDPEQRDVVSMLAGRKVKNGKYLRPYITTCIFPIILAIFGSGLVSFSALDDASEFWLGRSSIYPYGWLMGLLAFNRVVQNVFTEGYGFQKFIYGASRSYMNGKTPEEHSVATWIFPITRKIISRSGVEDDAIKLAIAKIDKKYHVHSSADKSYFLRSLMLLVAEVGFVIGLRAIIKYGLIHRDELTLEEEYLSYSIATFASVVIGHVWLVSGQYAADRVGLPKWLRGLNYLPTMGLPVVAGVAMQEFMTPDLMKGGVNKHDAENTADYLGATMAGVVAVTWDHVSHKLFLHPLNKFFSAVGRKCKSWWASLCGGSSSDSLDNTDEEALIANSSSSSSSSYQEITELTGGVALQSPTNPLINSECEPALVIASDTTSISGFSGNTNNQGESTPLLSHEAASIADSSRISPQ